MNRDQMIEELDVEIGRLQDARRILSGEATADKRFGGRLGKQRSGIGSPRKLINGRRRVMSPEARARIADAQRKRWAKQKGEPAPSTAVIPAAPVEVADKKKKRK